MNKYVQDFLGYCVIFGIGFLDGNLYANIKTETVTHENVKIAQEKSVMQSEHAVVNQHITDNKNLVFVEKFYNHDGSINRSIYKGVEESTIDAINSDRDDKYFYQESDQEDFDINKVTKSRPMSRLLVSGFASVEDFKDVQLQIAFRLLNFTYAAYQVSPDFSQSLIGAGAFLGPRVTLGFFTNPNDLNDFRIQIGSRLIYNTYVQFQSSYNFSNARIGLGVLL